MTKEGDNNAHAGDENPRLLLNWVAVRQALLVDSGLPALGRVLAPDVRR